MRIETNSKIFIKQLISASKSQNKLKCKQKTAKLAVFYAFFTFFYVF